ncbi:transmembrane protein 182-like isoform 2-T2 [Anomaloglossus baeobatrachus]|uniref:transmembrane protein 182-like isoform X2 n=1 Tax=Anomaloglossus baeobatrachus TaxID=238106 RepID=UPI003F4F6913
MKVGIASLSAGLVGGVGVLLFLVAFSTDYWLLATENCGDSGGLSSLAQNSTDAPPTPAAPLYFHHEGFFWRCWFNGEDFQETIWNFWFTSQAHPKHCIQGYLFPMPIAPGPVPHPSYDPTAGVLLALLIALFALWKEFAADLERYILLERSHSCPPDAHLHVYYGWSFMFAAAGAPLVLLSGLLFHCISRSLQVQEK